MPEHQPRDIAKEREGEGLGRCLGTAELHLTPCHFLGASTATCLPGLWMKCCGESSRATGIEENSSLLKSVSKNKRAETFLLLLASLLLTGRPGTSCALSCHLNEETQSRRTTRLLKSVVNPTSAQMKAKPQKLQL